MIRASARGFFAGWKVESHEQLESARSLALIGSARSPHYLFVVPDPRTTDSPQIFQILPKVGKNASCSTYDEVMHTYKNVTEIGKVWMVMTNQFVCPV